MKNISSNLTTYFNQMQRNIDSAKAKGTVHYGTQRYYSFKPERASLKRGWLSILVSMYYMNLTNHLHTMSWSNAILVTNNKYLKHCANTSTTYKTALRNHVGSYEYAETYFSRFNTTTKMAANYLNTIRGAMIDAGLVAKVRDGRTVYYNITELGRNVAKEAIANA